MRRGSRCGCRFRLSVLLYRGLARRRWRLGRLRLRGAGKAQCKQEGSIATHHALGEQVDGRESVAGGNAVGAGNTPGYRRRTLQPQPGAFRVAFLAGDEGRSSRINLVSLSLRPIYTRTQALTQAKVRMQVDAEKLNEFVKRELAGVSDARVVEHIRDCSYPPTPCFANGTTVRQGNNIPAGSFSTIQKVRIRQSAIANTALDRVARGVCSIAGTIPGIKAWEWIPPGFQLSLRRSLIHSQLLRFLSGEFSRLLATELALR